MENDLLETEPPFGLRAKYDRKTDLWVGPDGLRVYNMIRERRTADAVKLDKQRQEASSFKTIAHGGDRVMKQLHRIAEGASNSVVWCAQCGDDSGWIHTERQKPYPHMVTRRCDCLKRKHEKRKEKARSEKPTPPRQADLPT